MARTPGGPPFDPSMFSQMFTPKPYQNISELLGVLGNILVVGEKSQDEEFRKRYLNLFDVMFKGLALYMDKEFYQVGPNNPVRILVDKSEVFGENLPENGDEDN